MTQIKKIAWSGSAIALAAILAMAVLAQTASAAVTPTSTTMSVGGNITVAVEDDGTPTDVGYVTVAVIGSAGVVELNAASGDKQDIVCLDNTACDTDNTVGDISFRVNGVGAGSVLLDVDAFEADGTPIAAGTSQFAVTVNAAAGGVTVSASPATFAATGGTTTVTGTVTTSTGAPVANGTAVVFTTTMGTFTTCAGGTTGTQVCSTAVAGGAGQASAVITGGGLPGTATVTASSGGNSANTTVTLSGSAATVAISIASASIPAATTADVTYAIVTVRDAAGNPVSGVTPTVTVTDPATGAVTLNTGFDADAGGAAFQDCATGTNATGRCTVGITGVTTPGVHTLRARITVNGQPVDATATVRLARALDHVEVEVGPVENGLATVTVRALDVNGDPAANAAAGAVVGAASAGAVVNCSGVVNGEATCTYVPPTTPQTVTVTAVVTIGTVTKQGSVQVPNTGGETPGGEGSFSGTIADEGVSIVSFDGGTVADLGAAAEDAGLISVWVTVDGEFVGYIVGAPAFVNAAFNAQFADGLDAGTLAIVVK